MFWGLIMEPERRYTQIVKRSFRITMAALDMDTSSNLPTQVMCTYEKRTYLLCTLRKPDILQCQLNLEVSAGTQISFAANGNAHIHLTGCLTDVENEDDDFEEDGDFIEKAESRKRKKSEEKLNAISKKSKLLNGDLPDDSDSDDDDYEEDQDEEEGEGEGEEEEGGEDEQSDLESDAEEEEQETIEEEEEKKPQKIKQTKKEQQILPATKIKNQNEQKLKGGVVIQDIKEGSGNVAKPGRFISVHYEGRIEKNNKVFDSLTKGPGFKFRLGSGEVIKGWDTGVVGMKVGGVRKIKCPPNMAYGAKGSLPAIPPNATLNFSVTLKKVH